MSAISNLEMPSASADLFCENDPSSQLRSAQPNADTEETAVVHTKPSPNNVNHATKGRAAFKCRRPSNLRDTCCRDRRCNTFSTPKKLESRRMIAARISHENVSPTKMMLRKAPYLRSCQLKPDSFPILAMRSFYLPYTRTTWKFCQPEHVDLIHSLLMSNCNAFGLICRNGGSPIRLGDAALEVRITKSQRVGIRSLVVHVVFGCRFYIEEVRMDESRLGFICMKWQPLDDEMLTREDMLCPSLRSDFVNVKKGVDSLRRHGLRLSRFANHQPLWQEEPHRPNWLEEEDLSSLSEDCLCAKTLEISEWSLWACGVVNEHGMYNDQLSEVSVSEDVRLRMHVLGQICGRPSFI